ncbi:class I SAM-dependent methyltransferase [Streptosporangium sp. CA-115845]|uniref:class I SAM-dependent methyltransferase n=1 Tax=Streptosporangium sp. CA-115845 TaxID=3240071 RepID=UPI003D91B887
MLAESAAHFASLAPRTCGETGNGSCAWYHGSWQCFRLIDLVSNPDWHAEFYQRWLPPATAPAEVRALVSGTSDYTMPAYVLDALGEARRSVTVVDRCPTPLIACEWMAERLGVALATEHADVRDFRHGEFDLVCSDSFLSRSNGESRSALLDAWHALLAPGGRAVTTIRVLDPDIPVDRRETLVDSFVQTAVASWEPFQRDTRIPIPTVARLAEEYAAHAVDYELDTSEGVRKALDERFRIVHWETADSPNGAWRGRYVRVVLQKS